LVFLEIPTNKKGDKSYAQYKQNEENDDETKNTNGNYFQA
jgi:hypothetical protein